MLCELCGFLLYQNVAATASLIIRAGSSVLMSRRARNPAAGLLDFPGGFVEQRESLEQALERELMEELGFAARGYVYFMSAANIYPYQGVDYHLCDAYFLLDLPEPPEMTPADDVDALEWLVPDEVQRDMVAFQSVWDVVQRLRQGAGPMTGRVQK